MFMRNRVFKWLFVLVSFGISANLLAVQPKLNFIDIDSGPSVGLGDGLGSGAIVTLWGNNLGHIQNGSKVKFKSVNGDELDVAYIYYWKNADGQLPGGPADLYKSHKMQEIAFSIPPAPLGIGEIFVEVNGVKSNSLIFRVREGAIKYVAPGGSNKNNCTFNSPCGWINGDIRGQTDGLANGKLKAGDIVYSRGVEEPEYCSGDTCAGMFLRSLVGTEDAPISIIAYPGLRPKISSKNRGVNAYLSSHISISKYFISVGSKDPLSSPSPGSSALSDFHIQATKGRYVGNHLREREGACFNGWSGSIMAGKDGGNNAKIFGNQFYKLGCDNASRFQHTLYMSVRDGGSDVKAWEIAWNHLDNNESFYGIHNYDETFSGDCGKLTGELKIHNNYVINQKGAGIHISTRDSGGVKNICWEADINIFNNVLINVGLGPTAEENITNPGAIKISGDLGSKNISIVNNTIYGFSDESSRLYDEAKAIVVKLNLASPRLELVDNLIYSFGDFTFLDTNLSLDGVVNNVFYTTEKNISVKSIVPNSASNFSFDPDCQLLNDMIYCASVSKLIDAGLNKTDFDIVGSPRVGKSDIGAVEFLSGLATALPPLLRARTIY